MAESQEYTPFHPELDQRFPVKELKFDAESRRLIVEGKVQPMQWVSIFRGSPASNMEAEQLMGQIVTEEVRAGQWVDIPEPLEDREMEPVSFEIEGVHINIGAFSLEFVRAAQILYDRGLAQRVIDEQGRKYLRPTEKLMEFFGQRIGFKQP